MKWSFPGSVLMSEPSRATSNSCNTRAHWENRKYGFSGNVGKYRPNRRQCLSAANKASVSTRTLVSLATLDGCCLRITLFRLSRVKQRLPALAAPLRFNPLWCTGDTQHRARAFGSETPTVIGPLFQIYVAMFSVSRTNGLSPFLEIPFQVV